MGFGVLHRMLEQQHKDPRYRYDRYRTEWEANRGQPISKYSIQKLDHEVMPDVLDLHSDFESSLDVGQAKHRPLVLCARDRALLAPPMSYWALGCTLSAASSKGAADALLPDNIHPTMMLHESYELL